MTDNLEVSYSESDVLAGTDHITVSGSDIESTIEFYQEILDMPLVLRQPNLDRTELKHLFFDTGDGRMLTFFVNENRTPQGVLETDIGGVHHLAFTVKPEMFDELKTRLEEYEYKYSEFDRGAFYSIYTTDPNGLTIELAVDKHQIPDKLKGPAYALAQQKREEAGDEYVDDQHVQAAKDELGIETEMLDVGDAETGTDI